MKTLEHIGVETGKGKYYEEAIYSLALIYNVITDEITTYLSDFGLTPGKFNILLTIKHRGGEKGISQVDVSKHLIVTKSNLTKLIIKLEKDGLVSRSALVGDRRVNILKVTTKGSHLLDKIWDGYISKLKGLLSSMTSHKQETLSALLLDWLNNLRK